MTYNSTRKQFFAKLLGGVAAFGALPKLFAKGKLSTPASASPASAGAFQIRHDARAVVRRDVV